MEEDRKEVPEVLTLDKEKPAEGSALTNEVVSQMVSDLARDGRRYLSTIKALEDALLDAEPA